MKKIRVALLTNVLSTYRVACFRMLKEMWSGDITFYIMTRKMDHRDYVLADQETTGLQIEYLNSIKFSRQNLDHIHLSNMLPILKGDYDVIIIGGWAEPTYLILWGINILSTRKIVFWVESTSKDKIRSKTKELFKKILIKQAAACMVPGLRAFEYCEDLGMKPERIYVAPNAANRDYFKMKALALFKERENIRKELKCGEPCYLFVGRFVNEYKDISTLIEAFHQLPVSYSQATLLLVGDGPDRGRYERQVQELGLKDVTFLGMCDHETLTKIYAAADVFVFPSISEPWGFVLNEAMEFGLPLIVSDAVGAAPDLVHEGKNGIIFEAGNTKALAQALEKLARSQALREKMGKESLEIIKQFTPKRWAMGVIDCLSEVTSG